jgi:hypothetical protein
MGEVKSAVKGSGSKPSKKATKKAEGNLIDQAESLRAELSRLTVIKDEETVTEGDEEFAENVRKAAILRSSHSLVTAAKALLEEY